MAPDAMPRPAFSSGVACSLASDSLGTFHSKPWFGNAAFNRVSASSWFGHFVRAAWFLLVACIVQWPYRAAYHVSDDHYLQFLVGLLQTDRIGWASYLFQPLEGHFVPLWKLIYFAQWKVYGLNPTPWHFNITLVHVIGACLLYWLLGRYLKSWPAALFGATIWAAAAIGRWDNPFSWLATGQIPWSTMWLFAAMGCQSLAIETNSRRWKIFGTVCFGAAVLTWGAALALGLVLPLQLWLLESSETETSRRRSVLVYWTGSFCVLLAITLAALAPQMMTSDTQRSVPEIGEYFSRTLGQCSVTFATLTGWAYTTDPTAGLTGKLIATGLVFLIVLMLPNANRRVLAVFVALALVHLTLVNVFRADVGIEAALGWGRYLYFATLAWAVVAAVALDAILRLARGAAVWWLVVAAGCLLPLYVAHQFAIASDTIDDFFVFYDDERDHFNRQLQLAQWLDNQAAARNTKLQLLDIPVEIQPTKDIYFPLSAFIAVASPQEFDHLQFVRGDAAEDYDLDKTKQVLQRSASPLASQWLIQMERTSNLLEKLAWLSEQAASSQQEFEIPDRMVVLEPIGFPMTHLVGMHFPHGLPGCVVVPPSESPAAPFADKSDEQALWWQGVLSSDSPIVIVGDGS